MLDPTEPQESHQSPSEAPSSPEPTPDPPSVPLGEVEQQFVTLMTQHYMTHGSLPTAEMAQEEYAFKPTEFAAYLRDPRILAALEGFDVDLSFYRSLSNGGVSPAWTNRSLSAIQLLTIHTLVDAKDTRSHRKKLAELGVTTRQYNAWLRNPVFQQYLSNLTKEMMGSSVSEIRLALIDQATAGNIKAIEYAFEYMGEFTKQPERVITSTNSQFDPTTFIVNIIEILDEEIDDKNLAFRIAERLRQVSAMYNMAGSLASAGTPPVGALNSSAQKASIDNHVSYDGEEILEPEVVPTRELTPKMKQLKEKGYGSE